MANLQDCGYALSELDYRRFGVRTAKGICRDLNDWNIVADQILKDQIELALIRVPVAALMVVQKLLEAGALLCDVTAWFEKVLQQDQMLEADCKDHQVLESTLEVRLARSDEGPALEALATKIFAGYNNHYAADDRLPLSHTQEVYPDWLCRMHSSTDASVWVLMRESNLAGVAALTGIGSTHQDVALFGISEEYSGRGLGVRFLDRVVSLARRDGCEKLTYSTQTHNLAARRMACRSGFLPISDYFVFHIWTDRWGRCR